MSNALAGVVNNSAELLNAALSVDVSAAGVLVAGGFLYGGYRLFRAAQESDE